LPISTCSVPAPFAAAPGIPILVPKLRGYRVVASSAAFHEARDAICGDFRHCERRGCGLVAFANPRLLACRRRLFNDLFNTVFNQLLGRLLGRGG
jgi:hypothetical protein